MSETCKHCAEAIRLCCCGANGGRDHWINRGKTRWCPPGGQQVHEPAAEARADATLAPALRALNREAGDSIAARHEAGQ